MPTALSDLDLIRAYISDDDPLAAERVIIKILKSVSMLENLPQIGRLGRVAETRELSIARLPYYVVYRLREGNRIDVVNVMHERRHFPE